MNDLDNAIELGEVAVAITSRAAKALWENYPHLDRFEVLARFMAPSVAGHVARRYAESLKDGVKPVKAAEDSGTWLLENLGPHCLAAHERAEPMRLWRATRVGEVGYDELAHVAVRARSEAEAIRLAQDYAHKREGCGLVHFTAEPLPQEGEPGVVMEDLLNG